MECIHYKSQHTVHASCNKKEYHCLFLDIHVAQIVVIFNSQKIIYCYNEIMIQRELSSNTIIIIIIHNIIIIIVQTTHTHMYDT